MKNLLVVVGDVTSRQYAPICTSVGMDVKIVRFTVSEWYLATIAMVCTNAGDVRVPIGGRLKAHEFLQCDALRDDEIHPVQSLPHSVTDKMVQASLVIPGIRNVVAIVVPNEVVRSRETELFRDDLGRHIMVAQICADMPVTELYPVKLEGAFI